MSVQSVQEVFREVFEMPDLVIFPEMTAKDVKGWDSFNHINLIVSLEEAFGVTFTTDEIAGMVNVGSLISVLQARGCDVGW
jgi:acyl carrier protein